MTSPLIARTGQFVWLIEPDADGYFLFQFGPDGFVGAAYAMGSIVGPWLPVPSEVSDLQAFGIAQARKSN